MTRGRKGKKRQTRLSISGSKLLACIKPTANVIVISFRRSCKPTVGKAPCEPFISGPCRSATLVLPLIAACLQLLSKCSKLSGQVVSQSRHFQGSEHDVTYIAYGSESKVGKPMKTLVMIESTTLSYNYSCIKIDSRPYTANCGMCTITSQETISWERPKSLAML